jgi:hypothetical protein
MLIWLATDSQISINIVAELPQLLREMASLHIVSNIAIAAGFFLKMYQWFSPFCVIKFTTKWFFFL